MSCTVYRLDIELKRRYISGSLKSHTEMGIVHSRWNWKYNKGRWGRMATPKKNKLYKMFKV